MSRLLFRAKHGLHLYGLATDESPVLYYEVWDRLPNGASTLASKSTLRVSEREFMRRISVGWHDEIEVLSAPSDRIVFNLISELIPILRRKIISASPEFKNILQSSYQRRIKALVGSSIPEHRRQGVRLLHDLDRILTEGWFNPVAFSLTAFASLDLYKDEVPLLPDRWLAHLSTCAPAQVVETAASGKPNASSIADLPEQDLPLPLESRLVAASKPDNTRKNYFDLNRKSNVS